MNALMLVVRDACIASDEAYDALEKCVVPNHDIPIRERFELALCVMAEAGCIEDDNVDWDQMSPEIVDWAAAHADQKEITDWAFNFLKLDNEFSHISKALDEARLAVLKDTFGDDYQYMVDDDSEDHDDECTCDNNGSTANFN